MAYTLAGITSKVRQRIRDTNYSGSEITDYLNDTQNDIYNEYRLPFMEASANFTMGAGVADISNGAGLPTDYVQAVDIFITTTGLQSRLIYMDYDAMDEQYPNPTSTAYGRSVPRYWYYFASTINVFQVPSSAYTATMRYYKRPTTLAADADVPSLPSEFEEILVMGAAYRVMQVKDNYDQATILQNKYDEILAKLVYKYTQRQVGTPTIMRINRFPTRRRF